MTGGAELARVARASAARAVLPLAVGVSVFALLAVFAGVDPPRGVTFSGSPFSDEAWNVLNARNLAVLGRWATDDWNRQLVSVPFILLHALAFQIGGVGIIQARLVEIGAIALAAALLAGTLRKPLGTGPALLGAIGFATSALVLYYGRLVYLEPLTALGLTVAALLVLGIAARRPEIAGVAAGVAVACAIGTKLLALPDAAGIAAGVLLVDLLSRSALRWLAGMVGGLVVCVVLWGLVIWLPNQDAIAAVVRTWPPETLPRSISELVARMSQYLGSNDRTLIFSAPLLIGAGVGTVVGIARWRRLTAGSKRLLGAGLGWAVAGFGTLAIVPYAPNRYAVPTLPALALLLAVGAHAAVGWLRGSGARRGFALAAGGVLVAALMAGPGLWRYARWMASTPTTLPAIQDKVRTLIPAGAVVEGGYGPLFAMRADATTIITNFGANPGDLYATRGVRWYVGATTSSPAWVALHPGPWSQRQQVMCVTWDAVPICIYRLP